MVRAGDPLASLDTRDLRLERVRWQSQVEQLEKQRRQALATREASQVEILAASLAEARAELARIDDRLARADLVAPFDAIVISGDLSQRLGAPVEKGGVLFEVAPLDAYRMILKVEETDVAELRVGQTGRVVFAALPDESVPFRVEKLTPVAVAEEGRNYFRVEASLERAEPRLRPAIEGVAKVEVDRRRLIWIWSHDAIDWLRVALWRWLP
jgi:multidrug resistance efflux pump